MDFLLVEGHKKMQTPAYWGAGYSLTCGQDPSLLADKADTERQSIFRSTIKWRRKPYEEAQIHIVLNATFRFSSRLRIWIFISLLAS